MALQVWLPLRGDLKNLGLSDVNITNNGATINNDGKIGKCYSFNNTYIIGSKGPLSTSTEKFSIAFWIYFNSVASGYSCLYSQRTLIGEGITVWRHDTHIRFDDGSNIWEATNTFATGIWYHVVLTRTNTAKKLYINGVLIDSTTTVGILRNISTKFVVGRSAANVDTKAPSANPLNGKINDLKIYDHCLSPKEVKEISKGLVLHYPLDDMMRSNTNLLPVSNQRMTENGSTSSNEYMNLCSTLQIYETYGLVPYTISFEIKAAVPHSFNIYGDYGSHPKYLFSRKLINVTTEWQRFSHTFTPFLNNSSGTWAGISVYGTYGSGATVSVRKVKLELGSVETPLFDNKIVYDCSGYKNNGTIIGALSIITDTPRYNYSLYMNNTGTSNHIEANPIGISDNIFTVSFWIKATKSTNQVFVADPKIVIGMLNSLLYVVPTSSKPFTTTNFINNEWNHIVVIRNNTIYKVYINGIAETQSGSNNYYSHSVSKLWLLNRSTNNKYAANTSISDFRVYATALSDEDIKELYDTSAIIDNKGNLYGYLFEELSNNLFTLENWNEGSRSNVSYVNRNGSPSIPLNPSNFYYGSGDSRNRQFKNKFLPNTLYKFDLWIDTDSVVSNGVNVHAGIYVAYTDGTNSAYSLIPKGNSTNPLGYVHKTYYSSANKTIDGLDLYYHTEIAAYYRWDSVIIPMSNDTKIEKNGTISAGLFRENYDISLMHKGGNSDNNQLIEI